MAIQPRIRPASTGQPHGIPNAAPATLTDRSRSLLRTPPARPGERIVRIITTTDHKVIGNLYFATTFAFFLIGGALAMLIRAELWQPGLDIVDNPEQFNQLFTMHGTIMLLLFATPL
ncbi:MAG TPA: cbb3-type cytochrome c oxidase subunit I, partial [Phycicoccus sp.]|nr:cbb3-type cytochrome c oxidase subunit I [Phycicoccus sp.]